MDVKKQKQKKFSKVSHWYIFEYILNIYIFFSNQKWRFEKKIKNKKHLASLFVLLFIYLFVLIVLKLLTGC